MEDEDKIIDLFLDMQASFITTMLVQAFEDKKEIKDKIKKIMEDKKNEL